MLLYFSRRQTNDLSAHAGGVQMLAVEKNGESGLSKIHFRSWRNDSRNIPAVASSGGRCVSCHISGPRAIEPRKNPVFPTEFGGVESVDQLNALILRNGPWDYSPYYDPNYFPSDLKVGEGKCTGCHNGKRRQSLAFSLNKFGDFSLEQIHRKVVLEKTMPPPDDGEFPSDQERQKLVDYVSSDYRQRLKKWLTEIKCTNLSSGSKSGTSDQKPAQSSDAVR